MIVPTALGLSHQRTCAFCAVSSRAPRHCSRSQLSSCGVREGTNQSPPASSITPPANWIGRRAGGSTSRKSGAPSGGVQTLYKPCWKACIQTPVLVTQAHQLPEDLALGIACHEIHPRVLPRRGLAATAQHRHGAFTLVQTTACGSNGQGLQK